MDKRTLPYRLGELFNHLVRSPAGPLPAPLRRAAFEHAAQVGGGLREVLLSRGDVPAREIAKYESGLPEALAAVAARPDATAYDVDNAFAEAGRAAPRMMSALVKQVPRTRSSAYVPAVVQIAVATGRVSALARMVTLPTLTHQERLAVLTAIDAAILDVGPLACGLWLPDLASELHTLMRRDLAFARAALPALRSAPLLLSAPVGGLPDDPATQEKICLSLLASARDTDVIPPGRGVEPALAASRLTDLLPSTLPAVASIVRDDVLTGPWPTHLRMGEFAAALPHATPVAPDVVGDVVWLNALTYPDPYGHLADPLADLLRAALGDDPDRWDLLGRYSDTFSGTVRELLDVVTGVTSEPGATT